MQKRSTVIIDGTIRCDLGCDRYPGIGPVIPRSGTLHGFTLIELLVVISIIALLIALLLPALARAKEQTKIAACASNERQLAVGAHLFAMDHEGNLPGPSTAGGWSLYWFRIGPGGENDTFDAGDGPDFSALFPSYVNVREGFYCPTSTIQLTWELSSGSTYAWYEYSPSQGRWERTISYMYLGNRIPSPGPGMSLDAEIPKRDDDPGGYPLLADMLQGPPWEIMFGNHPGFWNVVNVDYQGSNVARLDTSVHWKPRAEINERRYGYAGSSGWFFAW